MHWNNSDEIQDSKKRIWMLERVWDAHDIAQTVCLSPDLLFQ